MNNVKQFVLLTVEDLEPGESTYTECPECGEPGKFSVTRADGGALYCCFRDSCDTKGFIGARSAIPAKRKKLRSKPGKPYEHPLRPLTGAERARFALDNGLFRNDLIRGRFKWAEHHDTYAFPVMDPRGYERGVTLRYYDGRKNKAIAYPDTGDLPWQAWYPTADNVPLGATFEVVALVEDQVSALKLSRYITTVAILGTSMSENQAMEISSVRPHKVIIALDEDAVNSAYKLRKYYGLLWGNVEVVHLTQDVKDMPEHEIWEKFCA